MKNPSSLPSLRLLVPMVMMLGISLSAHAQALSAETFPPPTPLERMGPDGVAPSTAVTGPGAFAQGSLSHRVIPAHGGTYGYEILIDDRVLIRQVTLPGREGNTGCPSPEKASELALLVISKMKAGISPPSLTPSEMTQLGL